MRRPAVQGLILLALVAIAIFVWNRSARRVDLLQASQATCEAVRKNDWAAAVDLSEGLIGTDPAALRAADCRCIGLMQTGRPLECVDFMEAVLKQDEVGRWLPLPLLTLALVERRLEKGALPQAAELAHRGAIQYPTNRILLERELALRVTIEDEELVMQEMEARLPSMGPAAPYLKAHIRKSLLKRKDWNRVLDLLEPLPPPEGTLLVEAWYNQKLAALAGLGRISELRELYQQWEESRSDPYYPKAAYALSLSIYGLRDPDRDTLDLLLEALEFRDELDDPSLKETLMIRTVGSLVVYQRYEEALQLFDEVADERGRVGGLTREDIYRAQLQGTFSEDLLSSVRGVLRFSAPVREAGDHLLISAPPSWGINSDYEKLTLPESGILEIDRALGTAPQRWVLTSKEGVAKASGTVWPIPNSIVHIDIDIQPEGAGELPTQYKPQQPEADGHRRVMVVILDCGDWRLVQYGRARSELPVLDYLIRSGQQAILTSDPPYTSAAMQAIANPAKQGTSGFFGVLHDIGVEIEALNFINSNPLDGLEWILPNVEDLFSVLGAGNRSVANLLQSYGGVQAGKNAQIVGPNKATRDVENYHFRRPLNAAETSRLSLLKTNANSTDQALFGEIAANFDVIAGLVSDDDVDLVVLRVAALDLLTHMHSAEIFNSGQDDGKKILFALYRYLDSRLGELFNRLDTDDILIVMSDHGIRTSLQHDKRAMFIAAGATVSPGKIPGEPEIRGIGQMLATLLGVETSWPDTGLGDWARQLVEVESDSGAR